MDPCERGSGGAADGLGESADDVETGLEDGGAIGSGEAALSAAAGEIDDGGGTVEGAGPRAEGEGVPVDGADAGGEGRVLLAGEDGDLPTGGGEGGDEEAAEKPSAARDHDAGSCVVEMCCIHGDRGWEGQSPPRPRRAKTLSPSFMAFWTRAAGMRLILSNHEALSSKKPLRSSRRWRV